MEDKNIIMYTMKSCGYCAKMKKSLKESEVEFEERNKDEWKEEWEKVKAITRSAVFPTFVVGKEYIVPNRDFHNPQEAIQTLQYYKTAYQGESTVTEVIELVKNSIFMVKMVLEKIDNLNKRLDEMENMKMGMDEKEKVREQIIQRNKLIVEQRRLNNPNMGEIMSKVNKEGQANAAELGKRYIERQKKNADGL
jgi:glutaredoxin